MSLTFNITKGQRIDLWLKASEACSQTLFSISIDNKLAYKIDTAASYYQYFTWTSYQDGVVSLEWFSENCDISLCYTWSPNTLAEQGVTFIGTEQSKLRLLSIQDVKDSYLEESLRPILHFSPHTGWMNDPNGFHFKDGEWHLFYQYHPHDANWGPMHWGHAVSKDLYHWKHYPVFLQPEQNLVALGATGGAFSGSAYIDLNGQTRFFYTERLPAYDLYRGYREIQKMAVPTHLYDKPEFVKTVLTELPPGVDCDFRDPKVWYEEKDNTFYMILGASVESEPAMLLFKSDDGECWNFHHVLYTAPEYFRENGGRCIECPDFFCIDGVWVLLIGVVGYKEPTTGRHNLLFAQTGDFSKGHFIPSDKPLQVLDFGTDFYALQTWGEEKERIGFAWLYNWATQKNVTSAYCGEMSLPRKFHLNKEQQVCMIPVLPSEELIKSKSYLDDALSWSSTEGCKACIIHIKPHHNFKVELIGNNEQRISLEHDGQRIILREHNESDDGRYHAPLTLVDDITLSFDAGIIEVFANKGSVCGTRRYYSCSHLSQVIVSGATATLTEYLPNH
ncbi:glycoside hydrolase family 32 protein [Vibrio viridaestus]|uniref:beta-fructofuranosidase n=1 Tax=Vibrio viridaestus TaxID=2487322 RepID=A0A3N9TF41_9VIBR|nr:glycoside hydrolase family 32 protein [Vibrio viridaestus]RQW62065.1 glycoside hydrolase family 32 protein [Vibrio viridaestus]